MEPINDDNDLKIPINEDKPSQEFTPPKSHQFRALFRKTTTLQLRQKANSFIQIITPILGLSIVVLFKALAEWQIDKIAPLYDLEFPFLTNMPYHYIQDPGMIVYTSNCDQWYLYEFSDDATQDTKDFVGFNTGIPMNSPNSTGMLESGTRIIQSKCFSPYQNVSASVPYFNTTSGNMNVNQQLKKTLKYLQNKTMKLLNFEEELDEIHLLPDGALVFYVANRTNLKYRLQINDKYYYQYHRNNAVSKLGVKLNGKSLMLYRSIEGSVSLADLINSAYIKTIYPKLVIKTGVNYLPMKLTQSARIERVIHLLGSGLFPLSLSLLLPAFIFLIVYEKEYKVLEIMKMNGMKMRYYWLVSFIFDYVLYAVTVFVYFVYGGLILGIDSFILTSWPLQIIHFASWGYAQIAQAFLVSPFLSRAQSATISGYVISLWLGVIALILNNTIYDIPNEMSPSLMFIPTFAFFRSYYRITHACGFETCYYTLGMVDPEVWRCIITLIATSTLYLILGLYLHEVIPQEYGVPQHPLFFLQWLKNCFCRSSKPERHRSSVKALLHHREDENEDPDCKRERECVEEIEELEDYPLVVRGLRKVFPATSEVPEKVAVNNVCFCVQKGQMFGLLGPNGAGKTTLISMLTGMYRPTDGEAWVGGFSLNDELDKIQLSIGVCPQFDILWPELTVEEHLLFYARLKGIQPNVEAEAVNNAMKEVYLEKFRTFKTKELSGGMRRRLSVAISLVGNPRVVFLDEPSTGLDPENRRQLWDILTQGKGKRAIILTTHSMEEADVLCSRIAIITHGTMRCIGNQVHLKNKFGGGYQLFVNCYQIKQLRLMRAKLLAADKSTLPMDTPELSLEILEASRRLKTIEIYKRAILYIKELIPNAKLVRAFQGNFVFEIPLQDLNVHNIFKQMETNKKRMLISDWGFSQCTLEDVFTKLVHDLL